MMTISGQYGGGGFSQGVNFADMKDKMAQMKEKMRANNPEMAKKMDEAEAKVNKLTEGGMSFQDAMKSVGEEMGLPKPGQGGFPGMSGAQGKGGINLMSLMQGLNKSDDADADAEAYYSAQKQNARTVSYSFQGQANQSAALQGFLDLLG